MSRTDRYVRQAEERHARRVAHLVWQRTTSPTVKAPTTLPTTFDVDAHRRALVGLAARMLVASPDVPRDVVRSRFVVAAADFTPPGVDPALVEEARAAAWREATGDA